MFREVFKIVCDHLESALKHIFKHKRDLKGEKEKEKEKGKRRKSQYMFTYNIIKISIIENLGGDVKSKFVDDARHDRQNFGITSWKELKKNKSKNKRKTEPKGKKGQSATK